MVRFVVSGQVHGIYDRDNRARAVGPSSGTMRPRSQRWTCSWCRRCVQAALWLHHRSTRSSGASLDCCDEKSDGRLDCAPAHRGFSVGFSTGLSDPRSGPRLRSSRLPADARNGHPGQTYCTSFALAERICRATDRVYSPRMSRSSDHWRRSTPPSRTGNVRAILQRGAHAPVARKRRSPNSPGPASWQSELVPRSRRLHHHYVRI
jgi:hypothetical protein